MKLKKQRKTKLFLIIVSLLLVSVITIGLTYAYLSAVTNVKNNVFIPVEVVYEPIPTPVLEGNPEETFDTDKAESFMPGMQITKQPKVRNTSYTMLNKLDDSGNVVMEGGQAVKEKTGVYAFIGAKIDYYIRIGDNWVRVSKEELAKFITIDTNNLVKTGAVPTSQVAQEAWFDISDDASFTGQLANADDNTLRSGTKSSYYIYGISVAGAGVQYDSTQTPKPTSEGGLTAAMYNKVTINSGLLLDPINGEDMTLADIQSATPLTKLYKSFEFDIVITPYGLLRDTTWTKEIATNEDSHPTKSGAGAVFGTKFAAMATADTAASVAYEEWSYSD